MELFRLHIPEQEPVPIIASLPHSGTYIPPAIAATMTAQHLESLPNTDWHLDRLYSFLPSLGITVLQATHSRYVVDLNRPVGEPLLGSFFSAPVARRSAMDQPIYDIEPGEDELQERIHQFYTPYHETLNALLDTTISRFGKVYLLHFHSFFGPFFGHVIDLGDGHGRGCTEFLISTVERHFRAAGYTTDRNHPFSGNHAANRYGQMTGVDSLQIEVRYHAYLAESQLDGETPPRLDVPEMEAAQIAFESIFRSIVREVVNRG